MIFDRPLPDPLYRLLGGRKQIWVDVWTPRGGRQVACVTSREAALAVLRLHGVTEYHDWTQPRAHWGSPLTTLEKEGKGTP